MPQRSSLKAPPKTARPLTGSGALPSPQNLINQTPQDLIRTLNRFGIDPDLQAIDRRARAAYRRLETIIAQGLEPDQATWDSLASQHEREMQQTLRQMVKASIRNYKNARMAGEAKQFMWVTSGRTNVCPSCEPRHGNIRTMAQWKSLGLPGSGNLICAEECNCQLVPAD